MEYLHLIGGEQVERAAYAMRDAAGTVERAATTMENAADQLTRALEEAVSRIERAAEQIAAVTAPTHEQQQEKKHGDEA